MIKRKIVILLVVLGLCPEMAIVGAATAKTGGQRLFYSAMRMPKRTGPLTRYAKSREIAPSGFSRSLFSGKSQPNNKLMSQQSSWNWFGNNATVHAAKIPLAAKVAIGVGAGALALYLKKKSYVDAVEQRIQAMRGDLNSTSLEEIQKEIIYMRYLATGSDEDLRAKAILLLTELEDLYLRKKYSSITPETILSYFQKNGEAALLYAIMHDIQSASKGREFYIPMPLREILKVVKNNPEVKTIMINTIEKEATVNKNGLQRAGPQAPFHKEWFVENLEQGLELYDLIKKELE